MSNRVQVLKPLNRYVTIVPHFDNEKTDSGVLLPDDFKKEESRYIKEAIVDIATDCKEDLKRHQRVGDAMTAIIDRTMIEEISIADKKHYVILENYIIGIYRRANES